MLLSLFSITKAISCEDLLKICVDMPEGPFSDGEIIYVEVGGFWQGSGIPSTVNEELHFSGDIDIVSISDNYPYEVLEIRIDGKGENSLTIKYDFEIEESQEAHYTFCSISETFVFDVASADNESEMSQKNYTIYPNPGDGIIKVLKIEMQQDNASFSTRVTDIHGNPLPNPALVHGADHSFMDISAFPSGFYFIYIIDEDESFERHRYFKL